MSEAKQKTTTDPKRQKKLNLYRFASQAHPSVLRAFKETQAFSELAALSIVIAAFSSDQPVARQYAVVAGAMFTLAFIFSTAVVLGAKEMMLEVFSFVVIGLGVASLVGVIVEYVIASKLLGSTLGLAGDIISGVLQLAVALPFGRDLIKNVRAKQHNRNWYLTVGTGLFGISAGLYNAITWLVIAPYREITQGTSDVGTFPYILLGGVAGIVIVRVADFIYHHQKAFQIDVTN